MSSSFFNLLDQNRPQTVFLPTVAFGYIYSKSDSTTTCSWANDVLPSLGGSQVTFLWLAVGSIILAAYMYGSQTKPKPPRELEDLLSVTTGTSLLQLVLLGYSFVELGIRTCSQDIIVTSLFLLYIALFVIRITEK